MSCFAQGHSYPPNYFRFLARQTDLLYKLSCHQFFLLKGQRAKSQTIRLYSGCLVQLVLTLQQLLPLLLQLFNGPVDVGHGQIAALGQRRYEPLDLLVDLYQSLGRLPENLGTAISCFREDEFVKKTLGEALCRRYAACRQEEWMDYERQVTSWELREYLYRY